MRTFTYSFQPDIVAQIADARSHTPADLLEEQRIRRSARFRTSSEVPRRIIRLQSANPNFLPASDSQDSNDSHHSQHPHLSHFSHRLRESPDPEAVPESVPAARSTSLTLPSRRRSRNASGSSIMSRPSSSHRPTHIALPTSGFSGPSPNGSPGRGAASPTSPRSSFLPSFMRTRSRAATITNSNRAVSPAVEAANPLGSTPNRHSHSRDPSAPGAGRDGGGVTRSVSTPLSGGLANGGEASSSSGPAINKEATVKTHRIRLVPHLETSRSLAFDPVIREVMPISVPHGSTPSKAVASIKTVGVTANGRPPALLLKIGRFTDKHTAQLAGAAATASIAAAGPSISGQANGSGIAGVPASTSATGSAVGSAFTVAPLTIAGGGGDVCSSKIAFRSKVVSRSHAEIWCESGGKFYIKDTSSSSGTFLNHIRLSSPNTESRPTLLNDGDVLQLGVDYQGGHEDQFRCVKMRVELGREWQRAANEFNTNALKQLKELGGAVGTPDSKGKSTEAPMVPSSGSKKGKGSVTDCCICLFSVTVCQSLFIAPCSHVFHYKCIRPLLMQHHPGFSCPLCRTFANLEEDVETEDAWEIASRRASVISRRPSNHSLRVPSSSEPVPPLPNGQNGTSIASVNQLPRSDDASHNISLHERGTDVPAGHAPSDIDMPAEADARANDSDTSGSISAVGTGNSMTIPVPINDDPLLNSFSEAQTPMNDTFLSTLAPSMQQRFDLAQRMEEVGRANEPLAENAEVEGESNAHRERSSDDGWMEVEREGAEAGRTSDGRRADVEMMFI